VFSDYSDGMTTFSPMRERELCPWHCLDAATAHYLSLIRQQQPTRKQIVKDFAHAHVQIWGRHWRYFVPVD
jgi:hypothetical protein